MGDRICITLKDGEYYSPTLYCHWAGLRALKALHDALEESRKEKENILCNLIIKVMEGECCDASYYLYNNRKDAGMTDYDNWSWVFNINSNTWTTTDPAFEGRTMSREEADEYVKRYRPCLYRECPCDESGKRPYCINFRKGRSS
ncbi:MAG: hypothetical protein FWC29_01530 [Methanomassiliicoccaceae archaeon]|nr:hypothetical protein [Methanomassiliicoccaceae archaeon]